ncbi:hypothetical protein L596_001420 [Steinernema carpocapsae]|uniref:Uncharacterized protein n=1 Tax=Steinernema carpocapsae TaxID=34508 RepID=A0A4U8UL03_STECR|nr:hypothetical protein L596_001420 [Steinernema carpocapsae]
MVKTSVIPSGTVSVSGNIKSGLVAKGTKAMCPKAQESMLHFKKKNSPGKYNRGHLWKASKSQLKRSETTKKATLRNMLKSGQLDLPLDSVSEPSNSECKPSGSSMETGNIPSAISAIGSSANHQWQPSKTTVCNGMLGQSSNRKDDSKDVEGRRQPTKIHPERHAAKSDSVGSKSMKPGQIPDNDSEWNSNFRESDYLCSTIPAIGSTTNHQWTPRKAAVSPDTNMNGMLEDVDDRLHDDTSEDVIDQRIELDSCDYYASINDSEWTSEDDFDDSDDEPMTPMRLSPIWERCEQEDSAEEESEDETLSVMEYLRGRQYKKYLPKKDKPVQATIEPVRAQVKVMKPAEPLSSVCLNMTKWSKR